MSLETGNLATSTGDGPHKNRIKGGRSQTPPSDQGQRAQEAVEPLDQSQQNHQDSEQQNMALQLNQSLTHGNPSLMKHIDEQGGGDCDSFPTRENDPCQVASENTHEHGPGGTPGEAHRLSPSGQPEFLGNHGGQEVPSTKLVNGRRMDGGSDELENSVRKSKTVISLRYDAGPPHGIGDYVGHVEDDVPHGKGTMEWPSGKRYTGQWYKGKRHGRGWHMWTDGRTFEGEWKDGKPHGMGKWTSPRGEAYDGELVRGKKCGMGTFTFADGRKYTGEWLDGMRHGKGTRDYPDGSSYTGYWAEDKRHGWGEYMWRDGRVWVGEWRDGNPVKCRRKPIDPGASAGLVRMDLDQPDALGIASDTNHQATDRHRNQHYQHQPREQSQVHRHQHDTVNGREHDFRRQNSGRHPPPAPMPRNKATAAAIKEMRELKEFLSTSDKLRKPIVLSDGDGEDTVERQGTASTQAGTMTASEWSGFSEPAGHSNGFTRHQGGPGQVDVREKDGNQDSQNPHEHGKQHPQVSSKSKGLFGGAAERIVQWGPSRVLTSVARRRGHETNSSGSQQHSQVQSQTQSESQSQSQPQSLSQSQSQLQSQSQPQSESQEATSDQSDHDADGIEDFDARMTVDNSGGVTRTPKRPERIPTGTSANNDGYSVTSQADSSAGVTRTPRRPERERDRVSRERIVDNEGYSVTAHADNSAGVSRTPMRPKRVHRENIGSNDGFSVSSHADSSGGVTRTPKRPERSSREKVDHDGYLVPVHAGNSSGTTRTPKRPERVSRGTIGGNDGYSGSSHADHSGGVTRTPSRPERVSREKMGGNDGYSVSGHGHDSPRYASHRREREQSSDDHGVGGSLFVNNGAPFEGGGMLFRSRSARSRVELPNRSRSQRERMMLVEQAEGAMGDRGRVRSRNMNDASVYYTGTNGNHMPRSWSETVPSPSSPNENSEFSMMAASSIGDERNRRGRVDSCETISGVRDANARPASHRSPPGSCRRSRGRSSCRESSPRGSRSRSRSHGVIDHRHANGYTDEHVPPSSYHSVPRSRRSSSVGVRRVETDDDTENELSDFDEVAMEREATRRTFHGGRRSLSTSRRHRRDESRETRRSSMDGETLVDSDHTAPESNYSMKAEGIRQIRAAAMRAFKPSSRKVLGNDGRDDREYTRGHQHSSRHRGRDLYDDGGGLRNSQNRSDSDVTAESGDRERGHRRSSSRAPKRRVKEMSFDAGSPQGVGKYVGEVLCGLPDGQGTITWPTGERYTGEWKEGKRSGRGTFSWEGGRVHMGNWLNNRAHGEGTFWYGDGSSYVGDWSEGFRHGHGTRTYADNSIYDGEWYNGMRHGKAIWCGPEGMYDGDYAHDTKNGHGTYTWIDGRKYTGGWKDGKMHGKGVLYSKSGTILVKGKWRKGEKTLFF